MKQSSLDITMNNVLDTIYNSNIDNIEKIELLMNIRLFFINYDKNIGGVEKEKIKTLDCSKEKGSDRK